MEPIHKFNNGRGATLCHLCRTIITVGKPTNDLYCDKCKQKNHIIEIMKDDEKTKCYCGHTTYCECGPDATSDAVIDSIIDVVNRQDDKGLGLYNNIVDDKGDIVGFIRT